MIAGMTCYQICWYFMFYSFCGWVTEVIYQAVTRGRVINRGFLNGPICPIYGFGVLSVIAVSNLAAQKGWITISSSQTDIHSLVILFLGSMLFATLVEGFGGWILDILFHMRWWDYSREPFNFQGYICLKFSILWGLAITGVILLIQPIMVRSQSFGVPERVGWPILAVMYALGAADFGITVAVIVGLNRRLEELNEIQKNMRTVSDRLSTSIGNRTICTSQRIGESRVQAALAKAEFRDSVREARREQLRKQARLRADWKQRLRELEQRRDALDVRKEELVEELLQRNLLKPGRILHDVPTLRHTQYEELLERLKKRI